MVQYQPFPSLLTEEDLPYTDDQPVDNELQLLIPVLLRAILSLLWAENPNWFFGINLGVYYDPALPAVGPDAFLSLGVLRYKKVRGRLSYVIAQENQVTPQWVLEVVSKKPGGEYTDKLELYAGIGVLYYTVYNPDYWRRDRHQPFEVYRLEQGTYVRQVDNPVWMPELGLGIGYELGTHEGLTREWLYWYDADGKRYPAPENVIQQERRLREDLEQRLSQAEQHLEREQQLRSHAEAQVEQERRLREELLERLRQQGIEVDGIMGSGEWESRER
jgi:Uma2 family endonuclease